MLSIKCTDKNFFFKFYAYCNFYFTTISKILVIFYWGKTVVDYLNKITVLKHRLEIVIVEKKTTKICISKIFFSHISKLFNTLQNLKLTRRY